jgi:N6-adenosine-specific RNA methylase IME4
MFSPLAQAPTKKYRTIVADPPWDYRGAGVGNFSGKGAGDKYPCMSVEQIMQLPVGAWAADDSTLWLWTTNSFLEQAYKIVRAWGFEARAPMTWVKGRIEGGRLIQHVGLGYLLRNSTEHALVATRGKPTTKNHDQPTAFIAPRGEHSEKPAAFYDIVEHVSMGPYLDVFARAQRFNWDTFGDEAFNFGTTQPPSAFTGAPQ